jgi:hypothetical protein
LSITGLQEQFNTLSPAIFAITGMVKARGETQAEHLQDVPDHVWEAVLHGIHSGGANALAAAQLCHRAHFLEFLTLDFVAESNEEGFKELMDEFAPCGDAVAQFSSADAIIAWVFNDED